MLIAGFVARFAPQEIQTHSQEFAKLSEHFVSTTLRTRRSNIPK